MSNAELMDLMDELCGERIDDAGAIRLELMLRGDSRARSTYRRYVNLHMGLKQYHTTSGEGFEDKLQAPGLGFLDEIAPSGSAGFFSLAMPYFAFLCAVVLLAGIVTFGVYSRRAIEPANQPQYAARLSRALDCVWDADDPKLKAGTRLEENRRLNLQKGLAELSFSNGTTVILQGPAMLNIASDTRIKLFSGKLVATVPKRAVGFSVETPEALIIDLGTEFGAAAGANGPTEVEVFQGRVEVVIVAPDRRNINAAIKGGASKIIEAGQVARVDLQAEEVAILTVDKQVEQFVRQFPATAINLPEECKKDN